MMLRRDGWRIWVSAAAFGLAADAIPSAIAGDIDPVVTGGVAPKMVWGGPVPAAPRPGEVPVYVPSRSVVPSRPQPQAYAPLAAPGAPGDGVTGVPEEAPDWPPSPAAALPDTSADLSPETPPSKTRQADTPADALAIDDGSGDVQLYTPIDGEAGAALDAGEAREASAEPGALAPLGAPIDVEEDPGFGTGEPRADPWAGLKDVTPGETPVRRTARPRPSYASLEAIAPPRRAGPQVLDDGRGALEDETPSGYQPMPRNEVMCRRALQQLGVKFVDASSISRGRSCGIDYPVKVTDIVPGVAIRPVATMNCMATLRVAQWMKNEVMPAARWKLLQRPTVLINASSYRCSRIAGSRSISQHASGDALDVRGFKFADGSFMEIERKGFFEFRQKAFQRKVRESACRYFGTVLGPGYNEDHADHLHLDTKQRRRAVCK